MALYALGEKRPTVGDNVFVAPDARVIGDVHIDNNVSVWWGCVVRGDNPDPIVLSEGCNIQDLTVIHTDPGQPTHVGKYCTIGHRALLHGCTIGDYSMVGMGAIVLNGAQVGRYSMIGAGSVVTENKTFPDGVLLVGTPARIVRELTTQEREKLEFLTDKYQRWGQIYRTDLRAC